MPRLVAGDGDAAVQEKARRGLWQRSIAGCSLEKDISKRFFQTSRATARQWSVGVFLSWVLSRLKRKTSITLSTPLSLLLLCREVGSEEELVLIGGNLRSTTKSLREPGGARCGEPTYARVPLGQCEGYHFKLSHLILYHSYSLHQAF